MFTRSIQQSQKVDQLVNVSFRILFSGAWTLGILCFFFADELLGLRYQDLLSETSDVFAILMLGFIAFATTYVYGTLITAKGDMRTLNLLAFGGLVLNLLLNLLLIPKYGAFGSAIATLVTQTLAALSQFFAAKTIFRLQNNIRLLSGVIVFSVLSSLAGYGLLQFDMHWLIRFFSLMLWSIILAWLSGLLPIKATMAMVKDRIGSRP
jgi:O-antigen/teichoic acid export membrane protein